MMESELGLEVFLTEGITGIGGKLRKIPEDFEVEEISVLPMPAADGKYVIAKVWHRNWEANRLVRRLASNLHVGRTRIGFAGTKDGRAVATQLMSFNAPLEDVKALQIPDVRIIDAYTSRRSLEIGDLIGNKFRIKVSDVAEGVDLPGTCEEVNKKLDEAGGFPNFFGVQRFGSIRPITHLIGKDLVMADFEGAVMRYIANPSEEENSEANDARRNLQQTRDFERALVEFPMKLTFERTIIEHLRDHPGDHVGALRRLPRNLLMMFVHAYQSYLFNRILSWRIRDGMSLRDPGIGDIILPLTKTNVPDHDTPITVAADNHDKAVKSAREGKAFVSGLIYGTSSVFAEGRMGEIERKIVESENIKNMDFQIVGLREASSKGTRRELLAPYRDFKIDLGPGEVTFRFALNKGCYATTLMREFMKADMSAY
ncbi:MAG: tRNA pseudouridine(13) synthase TruD [Euryarchaeota archaeon RBG_13_57_23]|nr:MAG: tRNA pseudouridine(13) synthase TruD [Euryarchaeota archaeon RBG_13_57_23]